MTPFEREWMTSQSASVSLPEGADGHAFLRSFDHKVPPRQCGRENWHRERSAVLALLEFLYEASPELFPATLVRTQAPDFQLHPLGSGRPIAIEHTDAGAPDYQSTLDQEARNENTEVTFIGARRNEGGKVEYIREWHGDAAETQFRVDVEVAALRKAAEKYWRNGASDARRWLLIYDNSEGSIFVEDAAALTLAQSALRMRESRNTQIERMYIVRGDRRVLLIEDAEFRG